jgi:hypothetical protein
VVIARREAEREASCFEPIFGGPRERSITVSDDDRSPNRPSVFAIQFHAMMFNVPQFIDVEDKIAGPLTAKQLFWMMGMFATIMVVAYFFPGAATYVIAVPVVIVFTLLAFYRPSGQPLIMYVVHGFFFLFRPKLLMWDRPKVSSGPSGRHAERKAPIQPKVTDLDEIRRMAEMMDKR